MAKSNKLEDQVFWYKADERPDFKIGAEPYWNYSEQNFSNNEQRSEGFNPAKMNKIKNPIEVTKLY